MTGLYIVLAVMTAAIVYSFVVLATLVRTVEAELQKHYDVHDMRHETTSNALASVRDEIQGLRTETLRRNNEARSWEANTGISISSCNYYAKRTASEAIEISRTLEALAKPDKNTKKQIDKAVKSSERTLKILAGLHSLSGRSKLFND